MDAGFLEASGGLMQTMFKILVGFSVLLLIGCPSPTGGGSSGGGSPGPTGTNFTVMYDGNGNTGGTVPSDSNTYLQGATVTALTNIGVLVKSGSIFAGWNTAADGSGSGYVAAATFSMGASNVILYARWIVTVIVSGTRLLVPVTEPNSLQSLI
jgi:hypothetical protein